MVLVPAAAAAAAAAAAEVAGGKLGSLRPIGAGGGTARGVAARRSIGRRGGAEPSREPSGESTAAAAPASNRRAWSAALGDSGRGERGGTARPPRAASPGGTGVPGGTDDLGGTGPAAGGVRGRRRPRRCPGSRGSGAVPRVMPVRPDPDMPDRPAGGGSPDTASSRWNAWSCHDPSPSSVAETSSGSPRRRFRRRAARAAERSSLSPSRAGSLAADGVGEGIRAPINETGRASPSSPYGACGTSLTRRRPPGRSGLIAGLG